MASERVYGALVRAYPEEVRRRYGGEMVRYFADLCREERRSRGSKGLVLLWVRTLPELILTVLRERTIVMARNAYLPIPPRFAARWGTFCALLGGALGTAYYLGLAMLPLSRWYGTQVGLEIFSLLTLYAAPLLCILGLFGLYGTLAVYSGRPDALAVAGAGLALLSAVSWLVLNGYAVASDLMTSRPADSSYPVLGLPLLEILAAATLGGWVIGLLLLGASVVRARMFGSLRLLPLVVGLLWPVAFILSTLLARIGYFPTLPWSLPFVGSALLGWLLLRSHDAAPSPSQNR